MKKITISKISLLHFIKLGSRLALFFAACILYIINRIKNTDDLFDNYESLPWILGIVWIIYAVEMGLRFFPSKLESPGCQKQFSRNFIPTEKEKPVLQSPWRTFSVVAVWLLLNGIIGILFFTHIIDKGILILISLFFGVCDMVCILFFCPFQTWFMKNRCCTSCRIYNWDFAMMFTPLVFVPGRYTWSLLALSLLLLLRWEITYIRHPERFSEEMNAFITCRNCTEKLCKHKTQIKKLIGNIANKVNKKS